MIGSPVRLSESRVVPRRAPLYGEHTEEVLTGLSRYSTDEVRRMREKGAI